MCGIAGAIGAIDPKIAAKVRVMMDAQVHRGPDDSGVFESGGRPGVVFGFRRLAIIDLSADGHQPMVDRDRGNAIVFNGEIYNFAEIRRELQDLGEVFRSQGDTEVLLRAYGRWGSQAVAKLRGMFAFAIYDAEERRVFIARDRLGIKPLYYAEIERPDGRVLLFASELRALLATDLFARHLDPTAVATYLWNGFVVGPGTAIRGISLLPAGCSLHVSLDAPRAAPERYWSLGPRPQRPADEAVQVLRTELATAARQHLVADVPLGVFLSGGVDSSATAALAVAAGSRQIRTFHICFDEAEFDESQYARAVATALGTEHVEFRLTQAHFHRELEAALASLDQPTFDGINTYFISRLVREAGFTVALAGTGGDELFGGYQSFRDLPRLRTLLRAAGIVPKTWLASMAKLIVRLKLGAPGEVPPQTRWGKLADVFSSGGAPLDLYQLAYGLFTREFLREVSVLGGVGTSSGLPAVRSKELTDAMGGLTPLAAVSVCELALFLGERLLRDTDAASMATSLEVRVPLLDHVVVEAIQAIPDAARFMPLGKKDLLKSVAMPNLDAKLFDRPKAGFVLPIEVWAKDQLAAGILDMFSDRPLVESVGLNSSLLQALLRAFRSNAPGIYWSRIWAPYVFLQWCRRHRVMLG